MKLAIEVPDTLISSIGSSVHADYWAHSRTNSRGQVEIREQECDAGKPGKWIPLTTKRKRQGLELMASKSPRQFGQALAGNADGNTGDIWLQLAILGFVKYA